MLLFRVKETLDGSILFRIHIKILFFEKNISHSLHYSEEALRKGDVMCEKAMHYLSVMHEKPFYHLSKTGSLVLIC